MKNPVSGTRQCACLVIDCGQMEGLNALSGLAACSVNPQVVRTDCDGVDQIDRVKMNIE